MDSSDVSNGSVMVGINVVGVDVDREGLRVGAVDGPGVGAMDGSGVGITEGE